MMMIMDTMQSASYEPFKLRHALQLAAPQTWPASVVPVLIGCALAYHAQESISAVMACVLLLICVLMQSSVNTFNDYFDYIKGTDTEEDLLEADDSTLVNDKVDPRCALGLAIALLIVAFALGVYVIARCGLIPLWIALVGAAVVVLYSAGKTPISSLPLGEAASGIVMGGLIPLACSFCLTGTLDFLVLLFSVPLIIGIGLIMMTNNACDIEKDIEARRRTLPVLVGRRRTRHLYHGLIVVWMVALCILTGIWFTQGAIMLPFMLLVAIPLMKALWKNPLTAQSRIAGMGSIASLNAVFGAFYALAIVF